MNGSESTDDLIGRTLAELPTPSVLIDLDVLERNLARMAQHLGSLGVRLRPHWKTTKSLDVAARQLAAGAIGFTAATAGEVRSLVEGGVPSVFWAYAPVGPPRVAVALSAARRTSLIVGTDGVDPVAELSDAAGSAGSTIAVRLEVDTGLGRTGVQPAEAVAVAQRLAGLPGLRLEGVYTHEGQVQGRGADPVARQGAGEAAGRLLVEVADAIRAAGVPLESVSVGSTPGAWSAPTIAGITEARPGTYAYGDENQVAIGTIEPADAAMTVLARVISVPSRERAVVDAGVKGMSSDASLHGDGRIGTLVDAAGTALGPVVSAGYEEHGGVPGLTGVRIGALVRIRPNHACGLTNMHHRVLAVRDDRVVEVWPVTGRH